MPNLAELTLIIIIVVVILSVHQLGRIGDAVGDRLRRLLSRRRGASQATEDEQV